MSAILEFFHNPDNLRTLCHTCHKSVTAKYITTKNLKPSIQDLIDRYSVDLSPLLGYEGL